MKMFLKGIIVLLALMLVIGCQQTNVNNNETALDYVTKLVMASSNGTITLDLSDDMQYQFAKEALANGAEASRGDTAETLAMLNEQRAIHQKSGVPVTETRAIDPNFLTVDHVACATSIGDKVIASGGVTIKDGATYMKVTIVVYNETGAQISKVNSTVLRMVNGAPYITTNGTDGYVGDASRLIVNVTPTIPSLTKLSRVRLVSTVTYTVGGVTKTTTTMRWSVVGFDLISKMEDMDIILPEDVNKNGVIGIGIDRYVSTLDYQPTDFSKTYKGIQVPFKGLLIIPPLPDGRIATKADIDPANTFIKLLPGCGGTIQATTDGFATGAFYNMITCNVQYDQYGNAIGTLVSWNIPREKIYFTFPTNSAGETYLALYKNLTGQGKPFDWLVNVSVKGTIAGSPVVLNYGISTPMLQISDALLISVIKKELVPMMFWWSCLAEGSLIRMADGNMLPVEKVREGDVVETASGLNLTVVATAVGEEKTMIRIVDGYIHSLLLSDAHPVKTLNRGIVKAFELKAGDIVDTENGPSPLTIVKKEVYNGKVYNLFLGTKEEAQIMPDNSNMFYAQGILVGDGNMQAGCKNCLQNY